MKLSAKAIFIPTLVLFIVCLVITAALAGTNAITAPKIAEVEAAEEQESRLVVLPDAEDFDTKTANDASGEEFTYYVGKANDETVGYVFVTQASGYGGKVKIMTGMDANGVITGVATLDVSNETPGLGANASKESFRDQFKEMDANDGQLAVQKDGGTVEALTGATITSRAVTNSVNLAIDQYQIVKEAA